MFSIIAKAVRRLIFQPAVAYYGERFFPPSGLFVEMGCGSAHSSARLPKHARTLIGLDFSPVALRAATREGSMDALLQADIFSLPLQSDSLAGIWNLGVMEHFSETELRTAFGEFRRVLKPGGVAILFWPTDRNASRWILGPLEKIITSLRKSEFTFFPGEISRLKSKHQARSLLESSGFRVDAVDFDWRTAFIHMVVVATKA